MFDRIFFPTLTFAALIAATAAFTIDAMNSSTPQSGQTVVQLERVVVVAKRDGQPLAVAQAAATETSN
jgi:hypothetical protein